MTVSHSAHVGEFMWRDTQETCLRVGLTPLQGMQSTYSKPQMTWQHLIWILQSKSQSCSCNLDAGAYQGKVPPRACVHNGAHLFWRKNIHDIPLTELISIWKTTNSKISWANIIFFSFCRSKVTNNSIGLMSIVFTNGPGGQSSIPVQVIPKTQKKKKKKKNDTWWCLA